MLANQLAADYDGDLMALDQPTQASLLLHLLHTREEKNIDETALNFLEDSLDLGEFSGLFTNPTVKQIMDLIVKHFVDAIRKQKIVQQEAELRLHFALLNFACEPQASQVS